MSEPDKIQKLEETVKFLRKELESQNLAILRLERAFESGEKLDSNEKPTLTLADMEFSLFGIEEKIKKHNELLKTIVISLVGLNDLFEQIRDFNKSALADMQFLIESTTNSYQDILSGSITSLRAEFLMALRDFREKYPKLEEIKLLQGDFDKKISPLSTIDTSSELWSSTQLKDLNRRTEELELLYEQNLNENLNTINKSLNYLLSKTKELDLQLKESKFKNNDNSEM